MNAYKQRKLLCMSLFMFRFYIAFCHIGMARLSIRFSFIFPIITYFAFCRNLAAATARDTLNCGVTVGRCELLDDTMVSE